MTSATTADTPVVESPPLTWNQRQFCYFYSQDFNGTKSYLKAFPETKNEKSAATLAWRLLKKVEIQQEIARLVAEQKSEDKLDREAVIARYQRIWDKCAQSVPATRADGSPVKDENGRQVYRLLDAKNALVANTKHGEILRVFPDQAANKNEIVINQAVAVQSNVAVITAADTDAMSSAARRELIALARAKEAQQKALLPSPAEYEIPERKGREYEISQGGAGNTKSPASPPENTKS